MINHFLKSYKIIIFGIIISMLFVLVTVFTSKKFKSDLDISCKSKGILSVNNLKFKYVNSYRFYKDGKGASSVSGDVTDSSERKERVGLQIYFDYSFESGLLTLRTTKIVLQVENKASNETIKKIFPPLYYSVGSEHKIAVMKMGSGYRFDYNAFPVNYCY